MDRDAKTMPAGSDHRGASASRPNVNDVCGDDALDPSRLEAMRSTLLEVAGLSEFFRVFADETRTKILYLLSQKELCVHDLAEVLEMTLPAVSHHLRFLKAMRLVRYRREGRHVFYSLADDHVLDIVEVARTHFEENR